MHIATNQTVASCHGNRPVAMRHQATLVMALPPLAVDHPAPVLSGPLHVKPRRYELVVGPQVEQEGLAETPDAVVDHFQAVQASFAPQLRARVEVLVCFHRRHDLEACERFLKLVKKQTNA